MCCILTSKTGSQVLFDSFEAICHSDGTAGTAGFWQRAAELLSECLQIQTYMHTVRQQH